MNITGPANEILINSKSLSEREKKWKLTGIIDRLERSTNRNKLGYGEHVCQFCDACGHNSEHKDKCPIGELWQFANEVL